MMFAWGLAPHLRSKITTIYLDASLVRGNQEILIEQSYLPPAIRKGFSPKKPPRSYFSAAFKESKKKGEKQEQSDQTNSKYSLWTATCATVGELKGLKNLHIRLGILNFSSMWELVEVPYGYLRYEYVDLVQSERLVMEPLERMKENIGTLENLVVVVNWRSRDHLEEGDWGFTVRRENCMQTRDEVMRGLVP